MIVKKYNHCYGVTVLVDGKPIDELTQEEVRRVVEAALAEALSVEEYAGETLANILSIVDSEYEGGRPCETCGEYDDTETWELI